MTSRIGMKSDGLVFVEIITALVVLSLITVLFHGMVSLLSRGTESSSRAVSAVAAVKRGIVCNESSDTKQLCGFKTGNRTYVLTESKYECLGRALYKMTCYVYKEGKENGLE